MTRLLGLPLKRVGRDSDGIREFDLMNSQLAENILLDKIRRLFINTFTWLEMENFAKRPVGPKIEK